MSRPLPKGATRGSHKGVSGCWIWGRDGHLKFKPGSFHSADRASRVQIVGDIEPFKNIGFDNKVIGGRRQKREFMRATGLAETGDWKTPPKKPYNAAAHRASVVNSLKQALHQHGV